MEISFKRQMNQSYMTIQDQFAEREPCELQMLANNGIPALLPVETEVRDGSVCYWYNITGYQSLADYLGRRQLDMGSLRLLLFSLASLYRQLGEYLLAEWPVLLKEAYIYLDFAGKHLAFTYVPGWREEPAEAFQELMGRLLQQLDHRDKRAVMVAYDLYQMSLQRELPLEEMLQQAMKKYLDEEEEVDAAALQPPETPAWKADGRENSSIDDSWGKGVGTTEKGGMGGFRERLSRFHKKEGFLARHERAGEPAYGVRRGREEEPSYGVRRNRAGEPVSAVRQEEAKACSAEFYGAGQEAAAHPTELLSGTGGLQGRLCYQGQKDWEDLLLGKGDFLVGKKRQEVDGYLPERSVSRIHARIEKAGENYFLEDLNSTNGTFLNGERLEYRQKAKLAAGDRIRFGNVEYRFM